MATQTIISLAALKASWDLHRKDYLENFVPIVAESIRLSAEDVISVPNVQAELRIRFGLTFPQNAIKTILSRVHKRGYLILQEKIYKRNREKLATLQFESIKQKVVGMHEALLRSLIQFCKEKYNVAWTTEDAEAALQAYVEANQLLVVAAATQGTLVPVVKHFPKSAKYLLGAFVRHLQETSSPDFEYLETVVVGNMLANAIFLPDPNQAERKFRRTNVYLDTPLLMYALGHAGSTRKEPCAELLELLYAVGANVRCFKHTFDEVRGALDACAYRIARGQLQDAYGPSMEHFLLSGCSASDVELFSAQLERDLKGLRIEIEEKPAYIHEYVIDEKALQDALRSAIHYVNPKALIRDVDSVAAIMRLRTGRDFSHIEECRAVFITPNAGLAKVSREHFYKDAPVGSVAPCMTDYALTNLLWLKKPIAAPTLPKKRIIADCYAATQPDEQFLKRFVVEVEKLEKLHKVAPDDVYVLRHSLEAKTALMDLTLGEEEAFTQGTVKEVLELIHSQKHGNLQSQLAAEAAFREKAEKTAESLKAKEYTRYANIGLLAKNISWYTARIFMVLVGTMLAISLVSTFPWNLPPIEEEWGRYLMAALQLALLVFEVSSYLFGVTVEGLARKIEILLSRWVEARLVTIFG